ncbi:MAG: hypothetical protein KDD51_01380 [Bdellovibrionales bacterium]|nr:hypothetical protein [Bdellovibrionales bacterium]
MKTFNYIALLCLVLLAHTVQAEAPSVQEVSALQVFLITETGEPTTTLSVAPSTPPDNVVFKYNVPETLKDYEAWALEINDPKRKLTYRMAFEGRMPPLLHWDGKFNATDQLLADQKHFYRLLLIRNGVEIYASPWASFLTQGVEGAGAKDFDQNVVKIGIIPTGAVYAAVIRAGNIQKLFFPVLQLDTQLAIGEKDTVGYRLETTSNILTASSDSTTFFYTDISVFYRRRLAGKPITSPTIQYFPPYVEADWTQKYEVKKLPAQTNFEVGMRMMISVLKGYEGRPLDDEAYGNLKGLVLTGHYSTPFGIFRLRADAEIGYSLFKGRFWMGGLELATTIELFPEISVGPHLRYKFTTGQRSVDEPLSNKYITNHFFLFGATVIFKI